MPTFSDLLKNFYEKEPQRVALYVLQGGQPDQPVTYRQLLQGAAAYAQAFEQHGVQPGEVVVLILQHGYDLIYAFFGAVLHGAIPSIMPFLTEKLLPERYRADLAALVAITQPSAIVTYPEFASEVHAALQDGSSVRSVIVSDKIGASRPAWQNPGRAGRRFYPRRSRHALTCSRPLGAIHPGGRRAPRKQIPGR